MNKVSSKTYIVAELSANHNQHFERAVATVRAAKASGADAIKLQTYTADTLTLDCDNELFRIKGGLWDGQTLYDLYREAYTPWEWHGELQAVAKDEGLDFFSTPFDITAVDFLESLKVPLYKVASFELIDIPLLRRIGATGRPVIMSTGMATTSEIEESIGVLRTSGCQQIALLKCTSAYPAQPRDMNLRTIPDMAKRFGVPVGLSDHTLGIAVSVAAVALGACIIEKHFTLSRAAGGPDSAFSMEPAEFREMVDAVRMTEKALGKVSYELTEGEKASRVFRRSLFVTQEMKAGDVYTEKNVRSIRPGHGLLPKRLPDVLGRKAACDIHLGTPLTEELIV